MKYEEFLSAFKSHVARLSFEKQLALALAVCKKLVFDYQKFVDTHRFGDLNTLIDAIEVCEQVRFSRPQLTRINETISKMEGVTPDMDDFGDEISSYALNACTAIIETLEFVKDKNPDRIHDIGSFLTDTVFVKIQENLTLSDDEVDEHTLMIEARNFLLK